MPVIAEASDDQVRLRGSGLRAGQGSDDVGRLGGYGLRVTQAQVIAEISRRLQRAVPAGSQVVLFGSRARDEAASDSDYDVLVIEPEVADPMKESVRLRRELSGLRAPIDVIVVPADHAERRAKVRGTVVDRALREGRVLART
jgi:predicted nucleotidyltransferase